MTTTNILSKTISTAAALLLCELTAHAATLMNGSTSGAGEIFVGFRATTSGSTGADKNIVIDIGSSFTLSQLTSAGSPLFLGNLGTNLAIYNDGTLGNWYNRTDLLWSAVSAVGATAISGQDPTNTLYGGVANPTGSGPVTTMSYTRAGSLSQQGIAGNILSMASGTQGFAAAPAGATSNIAVENTGESNSGVPNSPPHHSTTLPSRQPSNSSRHSPLACSLPALRAPSTSTACLRPALPTTTWGEPPPVPAAISSRSGSIAPAPSRRKPCRRRFRNLPASADSSPRPPRHRCPAPQARHQGLVPH